jgi:integrase
MKLEDDQRVIEFFLERESKSGTRKKYYTHLKHYIQHAGDNLTPTELIQEAINEERAGIYIEDRKITQRFLRLKAWLLEQEWADVSKRTVLSNIKTFYKTLHVHEIPATTIKVKRERQIRITDLPSQEEIKNAVLRANPKYQAVLLLMASSGLMQGDILSLRLTDFIESFNQQAGTRFNGVSDIDQLIQVAGEREIVIKWESGRYKNDVEYMTFSSPEATRAILEYLRIDPPKSETDFLFRTKGKQIQDRTLNMYIMTLNDWLGIKSSDKYKRIIPKNLRKRFGSILTEAGLGYRQIEYMMGHVLPAVQMAYFKLPGEEVMRNAYLNALPSLMIFEPLETRVLTTEDKAEFERMKERERQRELEQLEEKKAFEERMEKMERIIDDMKRKEKLD